MRALQCPLGLQAQLRWIMMRKRRKEGPRICGEGNKLEAVGRTTFQLYWTKTGAFYGMTASSAPCTRTKPLNSELFRRNYFPHQGAPLILKSDSYFRFLFLIRIFRSPSYRNAPKLPTTRMLSQDSTQRTSLYASHPPARRRRRRRRPPPRPPPHARRIFFFSIQKALFSIHHTT